MATISIPSREFPTIVSQGYNIFGVMWQGTLIQSYDTKSKAKSYCKYLRFWLRRLGKSQLIYSTELGQALATFLGKAQNPDGGFNPLWNVI